MLSYQLVDRAFSLASCLPLTDKIRRVRLSEAHLFKHLVQHLCMIIATLNIHFREAALLPSVLYTHIILKRGL